MLSYSLIVFTTLTYLTTFDFLSEGTTSHSPYLSLALSLSVT